jgi:outer membrane phospholipase A
MCYFVTVGISSEFAATLHYHVRNECNLARNNNPTLAQYFGAGEVAFDLVTGRQPCSCALYFDSNQKEPPEAAMRRLNYRKKGWAAEKVDRVIAEEFSIYKGNFTEGLTD